MSKLDDETCWRAVVNRRKDADGTFFYAVKTTGVFCRPSCPARPPLRKNVSYYATVSPTAPMEPFRDRRNGATP